MYYSIAFRNSLYTEGFLCDLHDRATYELFHVVGSLSRLELEYSVVLTRDHCLPVPSHIKLSVVFTQWLH